MTPPILTTLSNKLNMQHKQKTAKAPLLLLAFYQNTSKETLER